MLLISFRGLFQESFDIKVQSQRENPGWSRQPMDVERPESAHIDGKEELDGIRKQLMSFCFGADNKRDSLVGGFRQAEGLFWGSLGEARWEIGNVECSGSRKCCSEMKLQEKNFRFM